MKLNIKVTCVYTYAYYCLLRLPQECKCTRTIIFCMIRLLRPYSLPTTRKVGGDTKKGGYNWRSRREMCVSLTVVWWEGAWLTRHGS